jgi:hypothetical protein
MLYNVLIVDSYFINSTDAGASPSSFNEAWWKMTQHPVQRILTGLDPKEGVTLILRPL